jgi:hypothetical protein
MRSRTVTIATVTERPQTFNVPRIAKWAAASISRADLTQWGSQYGHSEARAFHLRVCIPGGRVMQTRNADIHFLFGLACRPDLWDAAHFDGVSGLRLCPAVRQRVLIMLVASEPN